MKKVFRLVGLDCANCAAKMERKINAIDGVKEAVVNFMTTKLTMEVEDSNVDEIIKKVEQAIKGVDNNVEMKRA
ncbi:Heavy-metal-associated domain-containing protein [Hathewaya proteolytica DSM 3090]|uniref:Heavy-metal-associated domain-containing protein n=1 Tax=Hathewaya proteolytica DSM 3090 TaxID=1121331 RepID=A0A1M6KAI8_9CLOT|nr:cation transporter [Hathewaya proteolytica]SHJ55917.1 Heavy-metal-associated domain-containing protein [Hathewaya proteolytica DSM 3090]